LAIVVVVSGVAITPNGAPGNGNTPALAFDSIPYTYTLAQTDIDNYYNFWLIATIPAGSFRSDSFLNMSTYTTSTKPAFHNVTKAAVSVDNGMSTNGQVLVNLTPRDTKLFQQTTTAMTWIVAGSGVQNLPYSVSLYKRAATQLSEVAGDLGTIGAYNGKVFTNLQVPCCGARWQMAVNTNSHTGYYLAAKLTVTNNTLWSTTMWESGVYGNPNTVYLNTDSTVYVQTCMNSSVCALYTAASIFEVQSPYDSPYAANFQVTFTLLQASNWNVTGSSSTGDDSSSSSGDESIAHQSIPSIISAILMFLAAAFTLRF